MPLCAEDERNVSSLFRTKINKDSVHVLQQDQGVYQSKVRDMISENKARLIVNINDLRRKNEARAAK